MKQRDTVTMPAEDVAKLLESGHKLQLATINPDGTPHLVSMFYGMRDGRIAFWTYRASQKARNLSRDPRLTCLVEDGEEYFELRGAQVSGRAQPILDPVGVAGVGRLVAEASLRVPADVVDAYVAQAALKRIAYVVEPVRVVSWDHRKLAASM